MTIIYVPGLGDGYDRLRQFCLSTWKIWGVDARLVSMKWYGPESFDDKLSRLKSEVSKYDEVIIVGESAGATMLLHLQEKDPANIRRYATLCGVCQKDMPIAIRLQHRSLAFLVATRTLKGRYSSQTLRNFRARYDPVIAPRYSVVTGARVTTIAGIGHFLTIVLCLTLYAPWFIYRLRKD